LSGASHIRPAAEIAQEATATFKLMRSKVYNLPRRAQSDRCSLGEVMKTGILNLVTGLAVLIVGIGITAATYSAARGGGSYVIAWGAILFGGIQVVIGLVQFTIYSFTEAGRGTWGRVLWPPNWTGRSVRLAVIAIVAVVTWIMLPERLKSRHVEPLKVFQAAGEVRGVAYSPDGMWIAAGVSYKGVQFWNVETGENAKDATVNIYDNIEAIAFSPDGRFFAASASSAIRVWDVRDLKTKGPTLIHELKDGGNGLAFSPDSQFLASGSVNRGVLVWDLARGALRWAGRDKNVVYAVAFSLDGQFLGVGQQYGLTVLNAVTGVPIPTFKPDYSGQVSTLAFFRDGRIASGNYYYDPEISIRDGSTGSLLRKLAQGSAGSPWSIKVSSHDALIVSGHNDGSVRVWNANSERPQYTIFAHNSVVRSIAISPDNSGVASGGDNDVKLWRLPTGEN
jgi:WD40 repeat protein